MFIEEDMARHVDATGGAIIAAVSFVVRGITKERARQGTRCKLVSCGCGDIRVAEASEDAELRVIRVYSVEQVKWGEVLARTTGASVEQKCGGAEGFCPKGKRHGSMD